MYHSGYLNRTKVRITAKAIDSNKVLIQIGDPINTAGVWTINENFERTGWTPIYNPAQHTPGFEIIDIDIP